MTVKGGLLEEIKGILGDLTRSVEDVVCMVVFGSFIRGYSGEGSDVDVAVILGGFEGLDSSHKVVGDRIWITVILVGDVVRTAYLIGLESYRRFRRKRWSQHY
ncbi:MAG: nucleotidyltransferase domain-containing protein [Desulfurococcales archaeon]|jgi:predicted nucleotidyltransferase|nr:nucleotidyltransferase domain-containing protein [Desulfurococcales archaeon]